ncbi:hypothetical protein Pla52o_16060 [Novipirellula galeiformis]|uniref:Uncharacterized protein n=1 Tax=Novipirellula galeiformis TaxID=2528004 RepID=A0A5C6CNX3_9BACT|nr:hypothetical protein Pla52o_16060 [Novipirellula galeiformis]
MAMRELSKYRFKALSGRRDAGVCVVANAPRKSVTFHGFHAFLTTASTRTCEIAYKQWLSVDSAPNLGPQPTQAGNLGCDESRQTNIKLDDDC